MTTPPRILIGDSSFEFGKIYKQHLAEENYTVLLTENNGERILSGIYALSPDVVIMNAHLNTSSADAKTVLKVIRGMRELSGTERPKVIVTAADQRLRKEMQSCGADEFLERPFQFSTLSECVERQLPQEIQEQRKRARELNTDDECEYVEDLLLEFGADPNKYGFAPMVGAIILYADGMERVTKDIYPRLARQYDRSIWAIEHEFRYLIDRVSENRHDPLLNRLLKPYRETGRPITNKLFIALVGTHVRRERLHRRRCKRG